MRRAWYRAYRPECFADVYGQAHITEILKMQVERGRVAHAYLFCGPRGTGKTTCAKILARAVNCSAPKGGEPCGKCQSCEAIGSGSDVDVVEIDAASNNGVDNIRDIRDRITLLPAQGKYKVYIIDEVHMLSGGAYNALLKTLEEPPAHAMFILATTEPRKLPATILSRCQRYDFKRISDEDIVARLRVICENEKISCEEEALAFIASCADGGMRDAISLLDQMSSYDAPITLKLVSESLGGSDTAQLLSIAEPLCAYDEKAAVSALTAAISSGADCDLLLRDLTAVLSDMYASAFLSVAGGFSRYYADITALAKAGERMGRDGLLRAIELLLLREPAVRMSAQPRILLISAVLRAMSPEADGDAGAQVDRLLARIEAMDGKIAELSREGVAKPRALMPEKTDAPKEEKVQPEKKQPKKTLPPKWSEVVAAMSSCNPSYIIAAKKMECIGMENGKITLRSPKDVSIIGEILKDDSFGDIIKKICREKFGEEFELQIVENTEDASPGHMQWDDVLETD